jgi:hypothetical protein
LLSKGRRTFDAPLLNPDLVSDISECLLELYRAIDKSEVPVVWVLQQAQSSQPVKVGKKGKALVESGASFLALIVMSHPVAQHCRESLETLCKGNLKSVENFDGNVVLCVEDLSRKKCEKLNRLRDVIPASLTMLIPSEGNAKITASNCAIARAALSNIFFGSEYESGRIAEQITNSRQEIVFLSDGKSEEKSNAGRKLPKDKWENIFGKSTSKTSPTHRLLSDTR